ncbi:hypothetical protein Z517_03761 [Fonsecaea pedrosoi CBS 271.37]|uniref:Transcription factor domain-containing protein n=1 Tax=Fonsecaea pedrosoi CBS 271.37 TaxID=1442368 RepID=A0A0D2E3D8_9EURO|nr:uncharacterized protein Z517_03761 [Fonsecaea pedrosoi CBS 271.37]KIW84511.1 hypothetical protein Z517_03761 [Fonsecaea pedrosoi CBS 271.37]
MGAREFIGHDSRNLSRDVLQEEGNGEGERSNTSRRLVTKAKLIITPLDSHRREAFASYPSGTSPLPTESIDEYISILRKEELCLKITPDVDHPVISVLFPLSMQDPGLFKCLLFGAQSLHDWRRDPFHVNRSRDMLKLQNEAILSLRERLSAPSAHLDDGVLISITHLMIADSSRRDLASLKSHLKGARQIISLRGGLGDTPAHLAIRALLTTMEFYIALGQYLQISPDDPTAIPKSHIEYIRHPFPPDICREVAALPVGLAEAALSGHLSVQCIKLLASVASWAPLVDGLTTSSSSSSSAASPSDQSQDLKTRYCRLFCEPRECSRSAIIILLDLKRSRLPVGLEHVICLGLAIAVRHLSGENRTNIFDTASLAALTKSVKAIESPSVSDSEVIIWLSLLISWRTQSAKPVPKADALLDYVLDSFPVSRSWKKVSAICRKFWWFDCFHAEWEKCWSRGMARQQQRLSMEQSSTTSSRRRSSVGQSDGIAALQSYTLHIESG